MNTRGKLVAFVFGGFLSLFLLWVLFFFFTPKDKPLVVSYSDFSVEYNFLLEIAQYKIKEGSVKQELLEKYLRESGVMEKNGRMIVHGSGEVTPKKVSFRFLEIDQSEQSKNVSKLFPVMSNGELVKYTTVSYVTTTESLDVSIFYSPSLFDHRSPKDSVHVFSRDTLRLLAGSVESGDPANIHNSFTEEELKSFFSVTSNSSLQRIGHVLANLHELVVPNAFAQCSGSFKCLINQDNCGCDGDPTSPCDWQGQDCGIGGTCQCTPICQLDTGSPQSCSGATSTQCYQSTDICNTGAYCGIDWGDCNWDNGCDPGWSFCGGCINACRNTATQTCNELIDIECNGDGGGGDGGSTGCWGCNGSSCGWLDPCTGPGNCDACTSDGGDGGGAATILGRVMVDVNRNGLPDDGNANSVQTPGNSCGAYYDWPNNNLRVSWTGATIGGVDVNTLNDAGPGCSPPYYAENNLNPGSHTVTLSGLSDPFGAGDWEITNITGCTFDAGNQTATCNLLDATNNQVWFMIAPQETKTCSVVPTATTVNYGDTLGLTFEGVSSNVVAEPVRLIMGKSDYTQLANVPDNMTEAVAGGVRYYYIHDITCNTSNSTQCQTSVNILTDDNMPVGDYFFHCDLPTDPGKCSGNPNCTYEEDVGGPANLNCSANGWVECNDSPTTPTDNVAVEVLCTPDCALQCGQDDGCGGTCGDSDNNPPGNLSNLQPSGNYDATSNIMTASWIAPVSGLANEYEVKILAQKPGGYTDFEIATALCDNAIIVIPGNDPTAHCATVSTESYDYDILSVALAEELGNAVTVAVRPVNSTCMPEIATTYYGSWAQTNVDLVARVSGSFFEDQGASQPGSLPGNPNICTQGGFSPGVNPDSGSSVSISSGQSTTTFLGNNFVLTNVPYHPVQWQSPSPSQVLTLDIVNGDPTNGLACGCPLDGGGVPGGTSCQYDTIPSPLSGANFYLLNANLSNGPWWQLFGGLTYATSGDITSDIPDTCDPSPQCSANFITQGVLPDGSPDLEEESAGVPMTSAAGTINVNGFYTERDPQTFVDSTTGGADHSQIARQDYDYYARDYDLTALTQLDETINDKPTSGLPQPDNSRVYYRPGNLIIEPNATWNVSGAERIIIFVEQDLTINNPNDLAQLITVDSGSYIIFLVNGNITIDSEVGHTTLTNITPNLEGVYAADGTLTIQTNGVANQGDRKFVGAGTFVGWAGVVLERDYDDGNLGRANNNTQPTELFIYRPDLVVNTPESLKRPGLIWQEVN